ncbi:MAG: stage II sporulation protein R [Firmicutes bacterium]|nr:stage II sporulation protein R [Bacillota bacterium]
MDIAFMRTRLVVSLCLLGAGALLGLLICSIGTHFSADTAFAQESLIRLHVLANSNRPQDQDLKLLVRDAVLQESGMILSQTKDKREAQILLQENRHKIKEIAENVVWSHGYNYPINVEMGNFLFPQRSYGPLILPEGLYDAVRIEIGQGKGENWWCVLFPPLCLGEIESAYSSQELLHISREKNARGIALRLKFWDQIAWTRYAQTLQKWWQVSAAAYPLLAN